MKRLINSFGKYFDLFEFIFVDDYSENKESINWIKQNLSNKKNVKIFELEKNTKRIGAFIKGIENANGKYIHSLDSDDTTSKRSLFKLNELLSSSQSNLIFWSFYFKHNTWKWKWKIGNEKLIFSGNTCVNSSFAKKINYESISFLNWCEDIELSFYWMSNTESILYSKFSFFKYHLYSHKTASQNQKKENYDFNGNIDFINEKIKYIDETIDKNKLNDSKYYKVVFGLLVDSLLKFHLGTNEYKLQITKDVLEKILSILNQFTCDKKLSKKHFKSFIEFIEINHGLKLK